MIYFMRNEICKKKKDVKNGNWKGEFRSKLETQKDKITSDNRK